MINPTANPSKLRYLNECYMKGMLTKKELIRLRAEAMKVNIYKQKVK